MSSDGTTIAVGALYNDGNGQNSGHVRVHSLGTSFNIWGQVGLDINGKSEFVLSGASLDMSGDGKTIAIGSLYNQHNDGQVAVYTFNPISILWEQIGTDILGEAAFDVSGWTIAMSIDGKTIAIGAPFNDGNGADSGHVRVYSWNPTLKAWVQVGLDINGEAPGDQSGYAVAMSADGKILAIGAPYNNGNGTSSGHVRVYSLNPTTKMWDQIGSDINGKAGSDRSGSAVAMSADGKTIAVGAPRNDENGAESGHVRVYSYTSTSNIWEQVGADINGEASGDNFGFSVVMSADGKTIAVGAPYHKVNGTSSGHVRVYSFGFTSKIWEQVGMDMNGKAKFDNFGDAIAMSDDGSTVAIGANGNIDNGISSGQVRVYKYESPPTKSPSKTPTKSPSKVPTIVQQPTNLPIETSSKCDESCGIFGLNIFCPLTFCGVMGRVLFNICDC
jgi:hypothetical protein